MTIGIRQRSAKFRCCGLSASVVLMSAVVGTSYVVLTPLVYRLHGGDGLFAAAVAAFVCWAGAIGSMLISDRLHGPNRVLASMLVGMSLRMALPLVVCMIAYLQAGALAEAGFVFYVLAFYLVTLAIDTWIAMGRAAGVRPPSEDS